jgi:hypothetical protein
MKKARDFLKKYRFDILVTLSVIAFIFDVYFKRHSFSITIIAFYVLGYAADAERGRTNIAERKRLGAMGLTPEDLKNIEFSKNWEETRKKGMIKFALIYGGLFFGFALCFIFSFLAMIAIKGVFEYVMEGPGNMLNFIGYTYVAGFIGGTLIYRISWNYNEQKFIRLTDPLH